MTLDEFFAGYEESRPLFEALRRVIDEFGPIELSVTRSQIAVHKAGQRSAFARVWLPKRYLQDRGAPLVLTLGFQHLERKYAVYDG